MSDALLALDRAKALARSLSRFNKACFQNLYVYPWDLKHLPAWQRGLQVFDGVPEVYPHAMVLIETLGPGRRREVGWMAEHWTPDFRATVGDVTHVARDLIQETWGWQSGHSRVELDRLVAERKRTGLPTLQRQNADWQGIIDSLSQEEWIEANMDPPPFHETVDPVKQEQFDRIVNARLDLTRPRADFSFGLADFSYFTSESYANSVKWLVYDRLNDLDDLEAEWNEPIGIDPRAEAELHDYEERPLIGLRAARVPLKTLRRLDECHYRLLLSIKAERRRVDQSRPPRETEIVTQTSLSSPHHSTSKVATRVKTASGSSLTPGSKAIAAAYEMQKLGHDVTLKGACEKAGVDRKNVRKRYPEVVRMIKDIGAAGRTLIRGVIDRKTGNLDGVDEDED